MNQASITIWAWAVPAKLVSNLPVPSSNYIALVYSTIRPLTRFILEVIVRLYWWIWVWVCLNWLRVKIHTMVELWDANLTYRASFSYLSAWWSKRFYGSIKTQAPKIWKKWSLAIVLHRLWTKYMCCNLMRRYIIMRSYSCSRRYCWMIGKFQESTTLTGVEKILEKRR